MTNPMGDQMVKRRILCLTATRADYPRVRPVLNEIRQRPALELQLIVTGMHLLPEYGHTLKEIEDDGFEICAKVKMYSGDDSPYGMAKAAAKCAAGIADVLNRAKPDIFLLTVDRVETLAAAQTAALMNIPIAHIQGGEITGTIDESIRHAVTKLAHIHFPATPDAAERIVKMGEKPIHVYTVGCPYIDTILALKHKAKEELAKRYNFKPQAPLVLLTQHPVTTEYGQGVEQVKEMIDALNHFPELEIIALYSNADAGGRDIIAAMSHNPRFHIFPNINHLDYLSLMKQAAFMIGNSSAGIREAPSFQLPVINIGSRQNGRLRADNVIDVPYDGTAIVSAIRKVMYDDGFKASLRGISNPYGDGHSAKRIVDILEAIEMKDNFVQKQIGY